MPPSKKCKREKKAQVCRICLTAEGEFSENNSNGDDWIRLMEYCIGVIVAPKIGPDKFCTICWNKLNDFSEFKTRALKSENVWNKVVCPKVKTDVEEIIEIKDEDDSMPLPDTEYLEIEFIDRPVQSEIKFVLEDDKSNIKTDESCEMKVFNVTSDDICKVEMPHSVIEGQPDDILIRRFFGVKKNRRGKHKISYECLQCCTRFVRKSSLAPHVKNCYDHEILIVKTKKSGEKRISKDITSKPECTEPSIFHCGLCAFTCSEEEVVLKHVNEHCRNNELSCTLCTFVGRDLADIVEHRYKHIPNHDSKFSCPACNNKFKINALTLQFHYRQVHLSKPGGLCSVCNKTFGSYKYFRNHERLHKEPNYICDFCGIKFLFRNAIVSHMEEHMNVRNFICHTCGKGFKRNNALEGHIKALHMQHKAVRCDHCGKTFKNQHSLEKHLKLIHSLNSYICEVCCKGLPTLSMLKKHMFWHTGERPYSCETCGAKYKSKGNLKIHLKKHMGIFNYKCDVCFKQFITLGQLKIHSSVHTGIRRVKCLLCDKTFHGKRQMLAHCQSKHDTSLLKSDDHSALVSLNLDPV